jgi:hypothetical protein
MLFEHASWVSTHIFIKVSGPLSTKGRSGRPRYHTVHDIHSQERDEISGPLRRAAGMEDTNEEHMYTGRKRKAKSFIVEEDMGSGQNVCSIMLVHFSNHS